MSETMAAPAAAAPSAPAPAPAASVGSEQTASIGSGNAPAAGGDAGAGESTMAGSPPPVAASGKFRFIGREWDSEKHAEEAIRAQIGRTPSVQRENEALRRRVAELESGASLRGPQMPQAGMEPGQGAQQARQAAAEPKSFADELAAGGDLDFIASLAENPEYGLKGAFYVLAQKIEERQNSSLENLKSEAITPIVQRNQQAQVVANGLREARELASQFPELDESNQSEEAIEAQQEILARFASFPPEWRAQNVGKALRMAVLDYRAEHGTPVFSLPPGTSGSPSSLLAAAAEAASSGATPLDGAGTPRPGTGREGPNERMRRENRAASGMATSESGRKLFRLD